MGRFISIFIIASFISFAVMAAALFLWAEFYPIENPSQGDGVGFAVAFGFIAAIPVSLIVGLIAGIIAYGFKDYNSPDNQPKDSSKDI